MNVKKYIIILLFITALLGAFGIVNRGSYTNLTSQENYLDHFFVGELPGELAQMHVKSMKSNLPSCRFIFSVVSAGELENMFHTCRQKVCVKQVFKGDILSGDEVYITSGRWFIDIDTEYPERTISRGFVNILQPDKEYLVFCEDKITSWFNIPVYKLYEESLIAPVFCYEVIENVIVPSVDGKSTYVPYEQVKENEFFGYDEEALDAWVDLKGTMLQLYSQA